MIPSSQLASIAYGIIILLAILTIFIVVFGYFMFFEGMWQGQTPGKKVAQIRVIDASGEPVNWPSVIIRNLFRAVDQGMLLIGLIVMLIDKNERRLGDLAANTLVIRERLAELSLVEIPVSPMAKEAGLTLDVGRISPEEYELLVNFLKRRQSMAKSQRPGSSGKTRAALPRQVVRTKQRRLARQRRVLPRACLLRLSVARAIEALQRRPWLLLGRRLPATRHRSSVLPDFKSWNLRDMSKERGATVPHRHLSWQFCISAIPTSEWRQSTLRGADCIRPQILCRVSNITGPRSGSGRMQSAPTAAAATGAVKPSTGGAKGNSPKAEPIA